MQHCRACAESSTTAASRTQTWRCAWRHPVASPLSTCTHKHTQPSRSSETQIIQFKAQERRHDLSRGSARHQGLPIFTLLRQPLRLGLCNPYPRSQVKRVNSWDEGFLLDQWVIQTFLWLTTSTGARRATPSRLEGFTSKSNKYATKIDEAQQVLKVLLALISSLILNQTLITHSHKERG
jgi:hypothetical protein